MTDTNTKLELESLAVEIRKRFEAENVTETDVEDAIEWARSE